jgi:tRNA U34 5-methylaminomethyl-2-thiouridine-forming methyltransferase MnmC
MSGEEGLERVQTGDGSWTWRLAERGVTYRSLHGAERESRHVFLEGTGLCGLAGSWSVLELGFGVGTNFVVTAREARARGVSLSYVAVEAAPPSPRVLEGVEGEAGEVAREALARARAGEARAEVGAEGLRLTLHRGLWLEAALGALSVDAVYYDPFGPADDPGSWCAASFAVAASALSARGVLGTYSASRLARRAMRGVGLVVAWAPGPQGKREVTFAGRSEEALRVRAGRSEGERLWEDESRRARQARWRS